MKQGDAVQDDLQHLSLLASAIGGRAIEVRAGPAGELAWTDGRTIIVDAFIPERAQVEALVVQASLISAGSFAPEVIRKLVRRKRLSDRYLFIEGTRAVDQIREILPSSLLGLANEKLTGRTNSPAASLALAKSSHSIPEALPYFGALHPRRLLAAARQADSAAQSHAVAAGPQPERVLAEREERSEEGGDGVSAFSLDGVSNFLGRQLQKLLQATRSDGDGQPAENATRYRAPFSERGNRSVVVSSSFGEPELSDHPRPGFQYDEWDWLGQCYRRHWCTVEEIEAKPVSNSEQVFDDLGLRRPLSRLGLGLEAGHRQRHGDDIDIDAVVTGRIEVQAGLSPDESFYLASQRRQRDLSVLVLLDISGSANELGTAQLPVHRHQSKAAAALVLTLHRLGDRVALYAYQSQGRRHVRVMEVKRFDNNVESQLIERLEGLVPGVFSRLGAAIRHGATVLANQGGTTRRVLIVLSDGLAYDHGYERRYGAEDVRRAVAEVRGNGTGCLCLTIGAISNAEDLQHVFGSTAYASVPKPEQLHQYIGPLLRLALRSAETKRRTSSNTLKSGE